ncbi:MAG: hypothetical protein WDW36_003718 [Sanguina aurantia]
MDEGRVQLKRRFVDFLETDNFPLPGLQGPWNYTTALADLYEADEDEDGGKSKYQLKSRRLVVYEHHLRSFDASLLTQLIQRPTESLPAFEDALREFVKAGADPQLLQLLENAKSDQLHIGLRGDFGRHEVSPRELTSNFLNRLVVVFGIVTKCSLVRPKIVKSVHYSEATRTFTQREYRDVTANSGAPTTAAYPQKDDSGNPLTTEYGLCTYRDNQMVSVQELPETAPPGQLPISTEIILEDDLVDRVKPGDRVSIVGVYKPLAGGKATGQTSGLFRAVVVGVSVQKLNRESQTRITVQDAREIKALSGRPRILSLLGASLAPSIYGHDTIKNGLLLQLFGGQEKNLANGTHLRGDINALLVGDPGVAKSQLLRAVMNVAPHAVSTTGRGSSGVGLTAAVTSDMETGEKRLEAGAMVLADRGVVCIDEFDKMSDQDRVAIHEVMEQQTVTIAKAGIHCSLNARCSVLAAANPLYGSYDRSISVTRNVNLPDSLLSRFDMLFVVLDQMTDARDKKVALHVLKQHRYRPQGDDGRGGAMQETIHDMELSSDRANDSGPMWLKVDTRLHGAAIDEDKQVLTTEFLRKYVVYSRRKYAKMATLEMDPQALDDIASYYIELRSEPKNRNFPVTARSLETLIRIATAHCKIRLDSTVSPEDVGVAISIMDHVMRKDIGVEDEEAGEGDDDQEADGFGRGGGGRLATAEEAEGEEEGAAAHRGKKRKNRWAPAAGPNDAQPGAGAAAGGGNGDSGSGDDGSDDDAPAQGGAAAATRRRAAKAVAQEAATVPPFATRSAKRQATEAEHTEAVAAAAAAVAATGLVAAGTSAAAAAAVQDSQETVAGSDLLTKQQQSAVHDEIRELFDTLTENGYPLALLQERLVARRVVIPDAVLAQYLEWVSASCNLTKLVKLYLPKLFWTEATQSFFNDNL